MSNLHIVPKLANGRPQTHLRARLIGVTSELGAPCASQNRAIVNPYFMRTSASRCSADTIDNSWRMARKDSGAPQSKCRQK
jgi:hypothetical protein